MLREEVSVEEPLAVNIRHDLGCRSLNGWSKAKEEAQVVDIHISILTSEVDFSPDSVLLGVTPKSSPRPYSESTTGTYFFALGLHGLDVDLPCKKKLPLE